jgi:hypothetical protein
MYERWLIGNVADQAFAEKRRCGRNLINERWTERIAIDKKEPDGSNEQSGYHVARLNSAQLAVELSLAVSQYCDVNSLATYLNSTRQIIKCSKSRKTRRTELRRVVMG